MGQYILLSKKYPQALRFYQKAVDLKRDYYSANYNIASIYFEQKEYANACFYLRKILQYHPNSTEASTMLGTAYLELEKYSEAKKILLALSKQQKDDFWVQNLLSQAYQKLKKYGRALDTGWQAVVLSEDDEGQHISFGYLLYEIAVESPKTDVKRYARKWMKNFPDNFVAQHMGNAILSTFAISQTNSDFVRGIFDAFALDFEDVLNSLDYSVPSIMSDCLSSLAKNIRLKKMSILDAGCGTGLCGKYLKKYAKIRGLEGVDLSEKMLEVAYLKNIYHKLYCQDICKFLASNKKRYDLINAADVYTYFGDLERLFSLLYSSLKKEGRILFSVSENSTNNDDYFLSLSGRFVHKKSYVENLLEAKGFVIEKINRFHLRNEGNKKVYGWIVLAKK